VRIADIVFRQGHLSEDALTAAVLNGERPAHLEQCDACSRQARELGLWLADLRAEGLAAADEAFPPEKLALQQSQIMRRLEQLDAPPRVIAFPAQAVSAPRTDAGRRVAPAWVGVAAAAGLVIGIVGGQVSARLAPATATAPAPVQTQQADPDSSATAQPVNASLLLDYDFERHIPDSLLIVDQATPRLTQTAAAR
jgi:hypothetical protein